jgi:hypothetical protein
MHKQSHVPPKWRKNDVGNVPKATFAEGNESEGVGRLLRVMKLRAGSAPGFSAYGSVRPTGRDRKAIAALAAFGPSS